MVRIGAYEILEFVARGGMGNIYLARHGRAKQHVAIKELRAELAFDKKARARFEREAQVLAQLPRHRNLIEYYETTAWNGGLYIVMQFVEGENLDEVARKGGVDAKTGSDILGQILDGIGTLHASRIAHRDLKLSNFILDHDGTPYISDFGISELVDDVVEMSPILSPKITPPECIIPGSSSGDPFLADIYSIGIAAYELFLGRERFRTVFNTIYTGGPSEAGRRWLTWHVDLAQTQPRLCDVDGDIPADLASVVERMMNKNPQDRYQSAWDAKRDLEASRKASRAGQNFFEDDEPTPTMRGAIEDSSERRIEPRPSPQRPAPLISRRTIQPSVPNRLASVSPTPGASRRDTWRISSRWVLAIGAGILVISAAIIFAIIFLFIPQQFTLRVKGAPPNSRVYVDESGKGVTNTDGTIRIPLLDSKRVHKVRIECDGYQSFEKTVRGSGGEEVSMQAALERNAVLPGGLRTEIDYHGPMLLVSAGPFIMGSDNNLDNEKPAHEVTLPDYYIDKFEVTNRQYKEFCEATNRPLPPPPVFDPSYFDKPEFPVVGVTWQDAADYSRWAGKRLPTESEWEKAASWGPSATEKRQWPWGNTFEADRGNIGGTESPTPVGQFSGGASGYGVIDMAGNVAEWVDGYYQAYAGNSIPDENYGTQNRVIRGGTFRKDQSDTRTSRRAWYPPEYSAIMIKDRVFVIGFRCAISATDPKLQEYLSRTTTTP